MKSITLKLDLYSKVILTTIALALLGLLFQGFGGNQNARAGYGDTRVEISNPDDIGDAVADALAWKTFDVNVTNSSDIGYEVRRYMDGVEITVGK